VAGGKISLVRKRDCYTSGNGGWSNVELGKKETQEGGKPRGVPQFGRGGGGHTSPKKIDRRKRKKKRGVNAKTSKKKKRAGEKGEGGGGVPGGKGE